MRNVSFKVEPFILIRTSRLPINQIINISKKNTQIKINNWLNLPGIKEALFVASPSLYQRLEEYEFGINIKEDEKLYISLLKYMIRMCFRTTPFGFFSGVSAGLLGHTNDLSLATYTADLYKARIDTGVLKEIRKDLLSNHNTDNSVCYTINKTGYVILDKFRYIEKENELYKLSEARLDIYLEFIIEISINKLNVKNLISKFLEKFTKFEKEEVKQYILQLITENILVDDFPLFITSSDRDSHILEYVKDIDGYRYFPKLKSLYDLYKNKTLSIENLHKVNKIITQIPVLSNKIKSSFPLQIDTYKTFKKAIICQKSVENVVNTLNIIFNLTDLEKHFDFSPFIQSFNKRFEGQLISLTTILDDELGIDIFNTSGYENPLLDNINLSRHSLPNTHSYNEFYSPLNNYIKNQIKSYGEESTVRLDYNYLLKLNKESNNNNCYPTSLGIMLSLFGSDKNNEIFKYVGAYGPSVSSLIGRFCHLDKSLLEVLKVHLKKESAKSKDVVFAEIVHLPTGNVGNVTTRPKLSDYEIILACNSNISDKSKIHISDLYVWVEDKQVKLWSKQLNKQVIPRLSSAHAYNNINQINIYRFLGALQSQIYDIPSVTFPSQLNSYNFMPRLMVNNIVLSEKYWVIPREEIESLFFAEESEFDKKLVLIKNKFKLDDTVIFYNGDNALQINIDNVFMLQILLSETKSSKNIKLSESLISKYKSPLNDCKGDSFNNEIIIPIHNDKAQEYKTNKVPNDPTYNNFKRKFPPGSEWLSYELYSGKVAIEDVFMKNIVPLINKHKDSFKEFFFIRYSNESGEWHFRIRFRGSPDFLYGYFLPLLTQKVTPLIDCNLITKANITTYEREVDRYCGPNIIEFAEELFMYDSEVAIEVIKLTKNYGEDVRWRFSLMFNVY